jgi:hypothetical protein
MSLNDYRAMLLHAHEKGWTRDLQRLKQLLPDLTTDARMIRGMSMFGWYSAALALGPDIMKAPHDILGDALEALCREMPLEMTAGELTLAGHANLFACCGYPDFTHYFNDRLRNVQTNRNGDFPEWHHAKVLAAIAFGDRALYRGPVGSMTLLDEDMPFSPRQLHGFNPQSFLGHLAAAVEARATVDDVWPAFEEFVLNFPRKEESGAFDGACLFWVARIVHHELGGRPIGQTCAWLHAHFEAWASGRALQAFEQHS